MWIVPGGEARRGENPEETLGRELREETGLPALGRVSEVWRRTHLLEVRGREILQIERYFVVATHRFEPEAAQLEHRGERDWFRGFRWWPIAELPDCSPDFAPTRLGERMRELLRCGVPARPRAIEV